MATTVHQAASPEAGYLRLRQIIGDSRRGIAPLIPISASSWWAGCKRGIYPRPLKLSPGVTVWRKSEVLAILERGGAG